MACWVTSHELSARYVVSEAQLVDYARRGNMPMVRQADGGMLFDEGHAAQLFRPRGTGAGPGRLGVVGITCLGDTTVAELRSRGIVSRGPSF